MCLRLTALADCLRPPQDRTNIQAPFALTQHAMAGNNNDRVLPTDEAASGTYVWRNFVDNHVLARVRLSSHSTRMPGPDSHDKLTACAGAAQICQNDSMHWVAEIVCACSLSKQTRRRLCRQPQVLLLPVRDPSQSLCYANIFKHSHCYRS